MTENVDSAAPAEEQPKKTRWGLIAIVLIAIAFVAILTFGMKRSAIDQPDGVAPNFEMQFFNGYE